MSNRNCRKMIFITLLLMMLISTTLCCALAQNASFADICAGYPVWADAYGLSVDRELKSEVTADGKETLMTIDKLFIYIGRNDFALHNLVLLYSYDGANATDSDLRAISLFSAMESPRPPEDYDDFKAVYSTASKILKNMKETRAEKSKELDRQEFVPFHVAHGAIYYLYRVEDLEFIWLN